MSNEQHKSRLKHAAEVLGWLAEGKTLQGKNTDPRGVWGPLVAPNPEGLVENILDGHCEYRIKPEPAEYESTVSHLATQLVIFAECGLQFGDKVRVTKIGED